jgi:hypothetical protein
MFNGTEIAEVYFNMTGYQQYEVCIDACLKCASVCNYCASACAKESDHTRSECIQLCLECSSLCIAAAQIMALGSLHIKEIARICAIMCDACADECGRHMDDHCRQAAEICTSCADECEVVAR